MAGLELPPNVPDELRAFVECRVDVTTIANGPLTWVEIPSGAKAFLGRDAGASIHARPGPSPDSAILDVAVGSIKVALPASVVGGKLAIDTRKLPFWAPGSIKREISAFVDALNAQLQANGKALGPPRIDANGLTLTKVALQR